MGWGRAAGALIALLISCALIDVARGGDLVQCEPQRVTGGYWAYRIIDGRECWYQGQPGKPKNELFWDRSPTERQRMDQPEAETKVEPPAPLPGLVAAPPQKIGDHRGNARGMARERSRPAACVHLLLA